MNKQLLTLAAALVLISTSSFAQLTSSPLEPGLFNFMKMSAKVTLVNSEVMTLGGMRIEYVSPEQVTMSAVVGMMSSDDPFQRVERLVSNYNDRASIGTMTIDVDGMVRMYHNVNPKQVNIAEMGKVITMFDDAQHQQAARFAETLAQN